jgi:hypothetical protein
MKALKEDKTKFLLPLDIQFFASEGEGEGDSEGDNQESTNESNQETTKQEQNENMIPKSRFDEINSKYKDMVSKLEAIEKDKSKQEKAEAEKRGEFEKLYREKEDEVKNLAPFKERTQALEGIISSMVESELKAIPEDYHELIPENLSIEQKLDWINKAKAKGMFKVEDNTEKTIGDPNTNRKETKRDTKTMSAMEKLLSGYSKK